MITIFTPTYNRAYILPQLFESLLNQTNKNFEWLIVDDGSTDDTKELIEQFILKADFKIQYIYQENQGKHVAINTALDYFDTSYFLTIDSDDYLKNNVISLIYTKIKAIDDIDDIIGVGFPLVMKDNQNNNSQFKEEFIATPIQSTYIYNIYAEYTFVYKKNIIKQYRYPVFPNEKFLLESVLTNRLKNHYKILHTPESIVVGEYMNDGLTINRKNMLTKNSKGAALAYLEKANNPMIPLISRKMFLKNYWDFESLHNPSKLSKFLKIKSFKLRLYLIIYLMNKIILKLK
ncbi:glycosyltransferase family 2 protein [Empedobacter falsenii]